MSNQGYWEREDGHPWESVDSLPPPLSEVSSPTPDPYRWECLESLPTPFDAEPTTSAPKKDLSSKAKEGWSFQNLKEEDADEEEQEEEWVETPKIPTTPRAPARPAIEDNVKAVGDNEYIPFGRLSAPGHAPARDPYPPYPKPPPWPYPGPLYPGPLSGATSQGPGHRHNGYPPVISLSRLVEQLGISGPVRDPRRSRRGRQRPLSPLSPPPNPSPSDFEITDISYEAHEERLYTDSREINFPKVPTYLPPAVKNTRSPLRGMWDYEERYTHTHTHRRFPGSYGHPAGPTTDPFREDQDRLWPRDKYQNLIPNRRNNARPMPPARNIGTLMKEWEDSGVVKISKRRKAEIKKEQRGADRYAYHVDRGGEGSRGRKVTVDHEKGDVEVEIEEHHKGDDDAPEWTDEEDRQRGRECLRRDSIDGHEIDDHNSIHYPPPLPQPFNVKLIRDKALKTLGDASKRNSKGKGKAPAPAMEEEDTEGIYDASLPSAFTKPKKPDPYASFKKTTGRHPRHYHKSRKHLDEAFERLVLDRRTLAEGEEEPTGKNKRKPMIDMVNLKTGERTRNKVRGYERLPRMIRVAAVEGLCGLPPRRRRDVEEVDVEGDEGEEAQKRRSKSRKAKPKKRDACIVM